MTYIYRLSSAQRRARGALFRRASRQALGSTAAAATAAMMTLSAIGRVASPLRGILVGRGAGHRGRARRTTTRPAAAAPSPPELSLGGYMKTGQPGLIVVEGTEPACADFVARL